NEVARVCQAFGGEPEETARVFLSDSHLNISPAYLRPGFAFGGSCLPNDVRSFLSLADRQSVPAPFLDRILPSNTAVIERGLAHIAKHGRQRIALFGLAFKQGTDDLRESPLVVLAERLIGRGYELSI